MLCYKEVCKYNGEYYSVYDNNYRYKVGEIAKPENNDSWIWATDSIESCKEYGYADYDVAILEMETVGHYTQNGTVVTAKAVRILREVEDEKGIERNRDEVAKDRSIAKLSAMVKKANKAYMYDM